MSNKLVTGIKYQLIDLMKPLLIFYAIEYGLVVVSLIITANTGEARITLGALEINSFVFLSICGVFTFIDDFKLFIQNGMTRKTIFKSFICEFTIISFLMALIETIIAQSLHTYFDYQYLFRMIYGDNHSVVISFLWLFALYFMVTLVVYTCATIKNKIGKKPFFIALVSLILIAFIFMPALNIATDGKLLNNFTPLLNKVLGFVDGKINLIYPIFTFAIIAGIAVIGSYLFTRKTEVI